jgi:hypothetical protein
MSHTAFQCGASFPEQERVTLGATPEPMEFSPSESVMVIHNSPENNSNLSIRNGKGHRRRYQLHLWINEREYTLLKSLSESQEEPMSRIVRRLFGHLKYLVDRKAS